MASLCFPQQANIPYANKSHFLILTTSQHVTHPNKIELFLRTPLKKNLLGVQNCHLPHLMNHLLNGGSLLCCSTLDSTRSPWTLSLKYTFRGTGLVPSKCLLSCSGGQYADQCSKAHEDCLISACRLCLALLQRLRDVCNDNEIHYAWWEGRNKRSYICSYMRERTTE